MKKIFDILKKLKNNISIIVISHNQDTLDYCDKVYEIKENKIHEKIKFIAELAQGYEGKIDQACELIKGAKLAKADFAKIQIVYADELATKDYKDYKIFQSLELNKREWKNIFKFSKKLKINLITEIFGKKSLQTAKFIGSSYYKLHPTDINNIELISELKKIKPKTIFIGIGGAKENEIRFCLNKLKGLNLVLLHGHQTLPTPNFDLNISRISKILKHFKDLNNNYSIGIADHVTPGDKYQLPIIAMALGAGVTFVEKHLTTNRVFELEDYYSALNPDEFKKFVHDCNDLIKIFGDQSFMLSKSEKKYRKLTRRVAITKVNLNKNTIISKNNIDYKKEFKKY